MNDDWIRGQKNWVHVCKDETIKKIKTSNEVRFSGIPDPRTQNIPIKFIVSAEMAFPGIIQIEACVLFLKEYGFTLGEIGEMIGRSKERVRQMVHVAKRHLNQIKQTHNISMVDS